MSLKSFHNGMKLKAQQASRPTKKPAIFKTPHTAGGHRKPRGK